MQKVEKRKYVYCQGHDFILTPIRKDTHWKKEINVSFCKGRFRKIDSQEIDCEKNSCSCLPVFNKDENAMTSAFISSMEKVFLHLS